MATTAQSGAWEDTATWIGGVVPTDVAIIAAAHTVTLNTAVTLGTPHSSVPEDTIICTVQGTLQRASGGSFTVCGDTRVENGFIDFATVPGGDWLFGPGGTAQRYKIRGSASSGQTASRIAFNGSLVSVASGAGVGRILPDSASWFLGVSLTDCVVTDLGTTAASYGFCAIDANLSGALQQFLIHDTSFDLCGAIRLLGCPADRNCDINGLKITRPAVAVGSALGLLLTTSARTTGTRVCKRVVAQDTYIGTSLSVKDFEQWDVICCRYTESSVTGSVPTARRNIIVIPRATGIKSSFGIVGETLENIGVFCDMVGEDNAGIDGYGVTAPGEVIYDKLICAHTDPRTGTDFFKPSHPTGAVGPWVYHIKRGLMTLGSAMLPAGNLGSFHGTNLTSVKWTRCTGGTHENVSPSSNSYFMGNVGTLYSGHASMVQQAEDCLVYAMTPMGSHGFGFLHYSGSFSALASASLAGTAAATSTTTRINCTGKGWGDATRQRFADGGAKVVITGKTGSGPPVGETRTISNNSTNWFEVSPVWSATPDTGTTFRIFILDCMVATEAGHNAFYNCRSGTNYQSDGYTTFTKLGYAGYTFTTPANLGVGDVDLGSGTLLTAGLFVDVTRTPWNYPSRYLGPAGLASTPALWATGQTYVVGDRVRAATTGVFAAEELWYVCHTSKGSASAAADKPGLDAAKSYWRSSYGHDVGEVLYAGTLIDDADLGLTDVSVVEHSLEWIRRGFATQDVRVHGVSSTGGDIGAVDYYNPTASFDSTTALVFGGSATMSPADPPPFSSTSALVLGGTATMSVANATGFVVGVAKVRHAISGRARVPGRRGVSVVVAQGAAATAEFDSSTALLLSGSASMSVAVQMASTAALTFGGSADMSVPVQMASTAALTFGGSATFTPASGAPADLTTLITTLGGNANVFAAYDYRAGKTIVTGVSNWVDARGAGFGPDLVQATTTKQPLDDGTTINFDGTDDVLYSAAVAGLSLDTSRSMAFIGATGTGNSKYCLVIRNAGGTRYLSIHIITSAISARNADSAGAFEQTTPTAPSTTIRCVFTQQQSGTRAMRTQVASSAPDATPTPTGTIASENKLIAVGAFNDAQTTFFSTAKVRAIIIGAAGVYWTSTEWNAIRDWAVTNHSSVTA